MMKRDYEFAKTVRDLKVYQAAFSSAMDIFKLSERFPKEEKYSLTDQIRKSSRSVCSNLAERRISEGILLHLFIC